MLQSLHKPDLVHVKRNFTHLSPVKNTLTISTFWGKQWRINFILKVQKPRKIWTEGACGWWHLQATWILHQMTYERTYKPLSRVQTLTSSIQKFSTLGSGGRGYYELYAVRNKTLVLKFARVDVVLELILILKILIIGRLCWPAARYEKAYCESLNHDLIMLQLLWCFYSTPKSPPKFNQFFIVPPRRCG